MQKGLYKRTQSAVSRLASAPGIGFVSQGRPHLTLQTSHLTLSQLASFRTPARGGGPPRSEFRVYAVLKPPEGGTPNAFLQPNRSNRSRRNGLAAAFVQTKPTGRFEAFSRWGIDFVSQDRPHLTFQTPHLTLPPIGFVSHKLSPPRHTGRRTIPGRNRTAAAPTGRQTQRMEDKRRHGFTRMNTARPSAGTKSVYRFAGCRRREGTTRASL